MFIAVLLPATDDILPAGDTVFFGNILSDLPLLTDDYRYIAEAMMMMMFVIHYVLMLCVSGITFAVL